MDLQYYKLVCLSVLLQTVENTVCILRNLSYRLESEVDPQEGGEDVLDREWEQEQRRDMDDLNKSFSKSSPGCLAFCARPRTRDDVPKVTLTNVARPVCSVDFVRPGGCGWGREGGGGEEGCGNWEVGWRSLV